jgi:ABC-2 type transport system permease protein
VSGSVTTPEALRELHGPEAIGNDWRRFLELTWTMTKTDWLSRYQGSVLGYAWTFLGPLLFAIVLYFGFSRILRFGGDIQNYQMVLILDIMIFSGFTDAAGRALNCMRASGGLLRQIELPRLALPLAAVATGIITMAINLVVVLVMALVVGVEPTAEWLLLPFAVVAMVIVVVPVAALLSVINARFRDVSQAWTAIARALFFASPVIIPIERYPESWAPVLQWNPLAVILAQARVWVIDPSAPTWGEVVGGWYLIVCPIAVVVLFAVLAVWAFRTQVARVAEEL